MDINIYLINVYYIISVTMFSWIWGSSEQKSKEQLVLPIEDTCERNKEFARIKHKYPDWLPVMVTFQSDRIKLTKTKYLTKENLPFKVFADIVRQHMYVNSDTNCPIDASLTLFFTANNSLIPANQEMKAVYDVHKKNEGFLHITVHLEPDQSDLVVSD